jgi:hypothetical protein
MQQRKMVAPRINKNVEKNKNWLLIKKRKRSGKNFSGF